MSDTMIAKPDKIIEVMRGDAEELKRLKRFKKRDTVIIIGTAGTMNVIPWELEDTDYWACSPAMTYKQVQGHRIDAIFEMHPMSKWKDMIQCLNGATKDKDTPVFMLQSQKQINNSVAYPIRAVQDMVANPKLKKYFTSTIAYMIALAIWMGYKCIELYGVHMAAAEERYSLQKSCCEAWLNYGLGRGIEYWLPDESSVMASSYMYGYEEENGHLLEVMNRRDMMAAGLKNMRKDLKKKEVDYWMQKGAVLGLTQYVDQLKNRG